MTNRNYNRFINQNAQSRIQQQQIAELTEQLIILKRNDGAFSKILQGHDQKLNKAFYVITKQEAELNFIKEISVSKDVLKKFVAAGSILVLSFTLLVESIRGLL